MMTTMFEIVHVHRDGTEEVVATVRYPGEVAAITETPKYVGTWIDENIKVLRWNRGELHIREKPHPMRVTGYREIRLGTMPLYELQVQHGELLKTILINAHTIIGYDMTKRPLWQTNSFNKLAQIVGKEVAYQVYEYYIKYLEATNQEGAM